LSASAFSPNNSRRQSVNVGTLGASLALRLPGQFLALAGERVLNRLRSLARLIGREPVVLPG
jgi:hypothetical protein